MEKFVDRIFNLVKTILFYHPLDLLVAKHVKITIREEVAWFSEQMEAKLRENDHKRHWSELSDDYLIERLYQEAQELWMAIKYEPRENVIKEAADVANFAMMIADNFSDREKKQSRVR